MGYTKLFNEILYSTIWQESNHVRIVWITMLALQNERNQVMASVPGLATASRVSREHCEEALKILSSPDPDSRSQDYEGRRIEKVDGGWLILNGAKFQRKQSAAEKREYNSNYMRKYRELKKNDLEIENDENSVRSVRNVRESGTLDQTRLDQTRLNNTFVENEFSTKQQLEKEFCKNCLEIGTISKVIDGCSYTFRCTCEKGQIYKNYPVFTNKTPKMQNPK